MGTPKDSGEAERMTNLKLALKDCDGLWWFLENYNRNPIARLLLDYFIFSVQYDLWAEQGNNEQCSRARGPQGRRSASHRTGRIAGAGRGSSGRGAAYNPFCEPSSNGVVFGGAEHTKTIPGARGMGEGALCRLRRASAATASGSRCGAHGFGESAKFATRLRAHALLC